MTLTDIFRATSLLTFSLPLHDIPDMFAVLATFELLRQGLRAATRPQTTKTRAVHCLLLTFASVGYLIFIFVALRFISRT